MDRQSEGQPVLDPISDWNVFIQVDKYPIKTSQYIFLFMTLLYIRSIEYVTYLTGVSLWVTLRKLWFLLPPRFLPFFLFLLCFSVPSTNFPYFSYATFPFPSISRISALLLPCISYSLYVFVTFTHAAKICKLVVDAHFGTLRKYTEFWRTQGFAGPPKPLTGLVDGAILEVKNNHI